MLSVNSTFFSNTSFVSCKAQLTQTRPIYIPNKIPDDSYIRIMDTTLRDGEQAPGASMTGYQKLEIARQLAPMGVDIIEAGFPCSSKEEFEAVRQIASEVGNSPNGAEYLPVIAAAARCVKEDIVAAWEAVKLAKYPRVCMFIATSSIHMKHKLGKTEEDVIRTVKEALAFAKSLGVVDLGFVSEDSARNVHGIDGVILATHCHNDLGLATSNTLAAASAGARQLEVTINGIGERAGNASLEEAPIFCFSSFFSLLF
ncbi:hypothetical protein Cgig2_004089 [Carnegiea gigantea]|uniref:Pyruvate carboxyltransferase domain-containing protein n=1 Tax=Carnegiea gigantea TaxID=171969 RepID=A0A9Q1KU90_9CARY|nr:hypothetical protein Cgig2_004089 [Carnegiea gigantea]